MLFCFSISSVMVNVKSQWICDPKNKEPKVLFFEEMVAFQPAGS